MKFIKALMISTVILCFTAFAKDVDTKAGIEAIKNGAVVIDVRTDNEWKEGHFPNALHMENVKLLDLISKTDIAKDDTIVLYCRSGGRAGRAADALTELGYTNVINAGGLKDIEQSKKTD